MPLRPTPRVGCAAAIFDRSGRLLLVRRADDGTWGLPGGWGEEGEGPRTTAEREVREETGLEVEALELIDVFHRLASTYGEPHTGWSLLFHCEIRGGELLSSSEECTEIMFDEYSHAREWHLDHELRARRAFRFWLDREHGRAAN
ncbi:MAG: NUDIX domain-containing protein [Candidatus Dormibacteria bacterium]